MLDLARARANDDRYLLLLGSDILLRERGIVSALRSYPGPVVGMSETPAAAPANRFFDHVLKADYYDERQALEAVRDFERETGLRPGAVVPVIEMTVHVSVAVARQAVTTPRHTSSIISIIAGERVCGRFTGCSRLLDHATLLPLVVPALPVPVPTGCGLVRARIAGVGTASWDAAAA